MTWLRKPLHETQIHFLSIFAYWSNDVVLVAAADSVRHLQLDNDAFIVLYVISHVPSSKHHFRATLRLSYPILITRDWSRCSVFRDPPSEPALWTFANTEIKSCIGLQQDQKEGRRDFNHVWQVYLSWLSSYSSRLGCQRSTNVDLASCTNWGRTNWGRTARCFAITWSSNKLQLNRQKKARQKWWP